MKEMKVRPHKNCIICGTLFYKQSNHNSKYWEIRIMCSQKCDAIYRTGKKVNNKPTDKPYLTEEWKEKLRLARNNKYAKFGHHNAKPKIPKICGHCSKNFEVSPYRIDAQFCCMKCKTDNSNRGLTTEANSIRRSKAYKDWRTSVFERDNYTCKNCGIHSGLGHTIILRADHIKPFVLYPELRLDINNGRTLCDNCHKKTDTYGRSALKFKEAI